MPAIELIYLNGPDVEALALGDDVRGAERGEHVLLILERVGQAEDLALEDHLVLGLHRRVFAQQPELHLEICSVCHPFFTGKQKLVDTAGRVEKFQRKYARNNASN